MQTDIRPKGVSVIVCTFNGSNRLTETIRCISAQVVPETMPWELIVADNGSTDGSAILAEKEWESKSLSKVQLHVVTVARPGKLFALQAAVLSAHFEYLIICDDDNWLETDYVAKVYGLLNDTPAIAALGGYGMATLDPGTNLPAWFNKYQYAYAVGPQATKTGPLKPRKYLWGAGMATRRSLYLEMYKTCPSLLELETRPQILSSEDTEYCLRLLLKNKQLFYDHSLRYYHYISRERLTTSYREKLLQGFLESDPVLSKYHIAIRLRAKTKSNPLMWLYILIASLLLVTFGRKKKAVRARDTLYYMIPLISTKDKMTKMVKEFMRDR